MPNINTITPVYYNPLWPYHYEFDNMPLKNIVARLDVVNNEVDRQGRILEYAKGDAGSLSNRLDQSLEADGDLKLTAVDDLMHNIAMHTDGLISVTGTELTQLETDTGITPIANPVNCVRMIKEERDKLALVASGATSLTITFPDSPSTIVTFSNAVVNFENSSTLEWSVTGNNVKADVLSYAMAHTHAFNQKLANTGLSPYTDYTYYTGPLPALVANSLCVYVNGIRLAESPFTTYIPTISGSTATWTAHTYVDNGDGTFTVTPGLPGTPIVVVDFAETI